MSSRTHDSAFANPPSSLISRLSSMLSALCLRMTSRLSYILLGRSSGVHPLSSLVPLPSSLLSLLSSVILLLFLASCGGGGGSSGPSGPANVGGGYTLQVSGGTLNDGSTPNGLVVLATLRDSEGFGPGVAAGWMITITGPGIGSPLTVNYDDGSSSSYITWWWVGLNPLSGTYTATASNGTTTLSYSFYIDNTEILLPPANLKRSTNAVSWDPVTGAGSYYYQVTDGNGSLVTNDYLPSSTTSFSLPTLLDDGSYLIEVFAHTKDRTDLMADPSPSPSLPPQENISLATTDFVIGGGYSLNARGGVLYEGTDGNGNPHYGFVVWTSILTTTTTPAPPASDWNISVSGPGDLAVVPITFTYPGTYSHYICWDFGAVPTGGSYTVTAVSSGGTKLTQTFTIPNLTAQFPIATGISLAQTPSRGGTVTWNPVPGAGSYYVNIWTCVGPGSVNEPLGCTNNGVYTEIAAGWVNANAAVIVNNTFTKGIVYDVYVTASALDMTTTKATPPPTPGTQVDMSDTYFTYYTFTAQ